MKKYKLYQVKRDLTYTHGFMGLDMMKDLGVRVNLDNYDLVYSGTTENDSSVLGELFERFNINRPHDFRGRSMSVSDIVEIDERYFYCDSYGWEELNFN